MTTKQQHKTQSVTIPFSLERETKGALRYKEIDEQGKDLEIGNGARIGTLYVRKSTFGSEQPAVISLLLTW